MRRQILDAQSFLPHIFESLTGCSGGAPRSPTIHRTPSLLLRLSCLPALSTQILTQQTHRCILPSWCSRHSNISRRSWATNTLAWCCRNGGRFYFECALTCDNSPTTRPSTNNLNYAGTRKHSIATETRIPHKHLIMTSSNPFRKKSEAAASVTTFNHPAPVSAETRFPALKNIDTAPTPPPRTTFIKTDSLAADAKSKATKKVRVLSPPPLSPDSPEWPHVPSSLPASTFGQRRIEGANDDYYTDDSDPGAASPSVPGHTHDGARVPGNPFSKNLSDIELPEGEIKLEQERKDEGDALKAANATRRSLDVNSFRRLLMTGNSGSGGSTNVAKSRQSMPPPRRAADSSSVSLASTNDSFREAITYGREPFESCLISQEDPDTPEDELDHSQLSDSSVSAPANKSKKPPPPPSSRHGKSIRLELTGSQAPPDALVSMSASDINKPLPPAPVRKSLEDEPESPFDQEAAGKVPEVAMDITSPSAPAGRKAVPAPPPRRGHNRGESRAFGANTSGLGQGPLKINDENISRSSSLRSRNSHTRHESLAQAPPPPPRRSHHNSRQSTQISPAVVASVGAELSSSSQSPAALSEAERTATSTPSYYSTSIEPPAPRALQLGSGQIGGPKASAPPPPPARNTSVRRPASLRSIESAGRRVSYEAKPHNPLAPPPPPTRRQRGSSRGSMDGQYRRTSMDSVGRGEASPLTEEKTENDETCVKPEPTSPQLAADAGKGINILADLDALQREVDALRGKMK